MKWTAPLNNGGSPITLYRVYSDLGIGSAYSLVGSSTSTEFTHSNISPPGSTFNYQVSAVNAAGEGPLSSVVGVILATVPEKPNAPTVTSTTQTSISILWTAPANGGSLITQYVIMYNAGINNAYIQAGTSTIPSFTISGLTTGRGYRFTVQAVNAVGSGEASSPSLEIISAVVPGAPGTPTYLTSSPTQVAF